MGYYTDYRLTIYTSNHEEVHENDVIFKDLEENFLNITSYELSYDDPDLYSIKWYDYEKDMRKLSSIYPTYYFHLEGVGEGRGYETDIWQIVYENGKRIAEYSVENKDPSFKMMMNEYKI